MTLVVGVDPGGRSCGVVSREGDRMTRATLCTRTDAQTDAQWLREVVETICQHRTTRSTVAVEGLTHPNPHLGLANVTGLLNTAQVLGAVLFAIPDAIVVAPGGNGSAPLSAYPAELVGAREKQGTGKRRHLRSAWDVAGSVCGGV